jgi:excisionase family DNA binding protein
MAETFLTVEQAARELQVTPYTLREWLKARRLRGVKIGGYWRVPAVALEELANGTDDAEERAASAAYDRAKASGESPVPLSDALALNESERAAR